MVCNGRKMMGIKNDKKDVKQRGPHDDWKRNYALILDYIKMFPDDALWTPETKKRVTYTLNVEKCQLEHENYPWLFWVVVHKHTPYFYGAFPLLLHQPYDEFISQFKKAFPFKLLIEKIISG